MPIGFISLEKAYDTISRNMAEARLGRMGISEAEVRMIEGTYEDTMSTLLCGP